MFEFISILERFFFFLSRENWSRVMIRGIREISGTNLIRIRYLSALSRLAWFWGRIAYRWLIADISMSLRYKIFSFFPILYSFMKLVNIFSVNPHLGPLQISLGRMIIDIIKFFFIYTLVLFAFGCGKYKLWNSDNESVFNSFSWVSNPTSYTSVSRSMYILWWLPVSRK